MASWSVQSLLHSSRQTVPILYNGPPPPSSKLPFALGDLEAHLIHDFLGPPEFTSQTTCRSVQQFLQAHYCDRQTNTDHATPSITFRVHNTSYSPFIETMHLSWTIFGRLFLKRFALCYWTVVSPVLPLSDVGVLWPNGRMDQDATCYRGRPRPRPDYVRWRPSSPLPP